MLDAGFHNLDCMDGMAQFPDKFFELAIVSKTIKPLCIALNVRKIQRACFKRSVILSKHPVNLGNVYAELTRNFRMVSSLAQFNCFSVIDFTKFVIMRAAQRIDSKIKSCGHFAIKQIANLSGIKANKGEYINLIVIIPLGIVFPVSLNVENIRLAFLLPLRNGARACRGLYLNAQKTLSVIHQHIIRKSLLAGKCDKSFHNKVCANHVFPGLPDLEFITNSHTITSQVLYYAYFGVSTAKYNEVMV